MGISIEFLTHPIGDSVLALNWLSTPVSILWIVGIMNTFNLIDGLDGLAAGIAAIAASFLAIAAIQQANFPVAVLAIATLGACIGFLRITTHPLKFLWETQARCYWDICWPSYHYRRNEKHSCISSIDPHINFRYPDFGHGFCHNWAFEKWAGNIQARYPTFTSSAHWKRPFE